MKKISRRKFTRILGCGCAMSLSSCSYNPINKRSQLSIIPERIVKHMSDEYYYEFLADNDLVKNKKLVKKVREIGKRIEIGIKKYFEKENRLDEYEKYQYDYEINIVKDKRTINAFAMPTAKIVFFSRILDFTKNEDEILIALDYYRKGIATIIKEPVEKISFKMINDVSDGFDKSNMLEYLNDMVIGI